MHYFMGGGSRTPMIFSSWKNWFMCLCKFIIFKVYLSSSNKCPRHYKSFGLNRFQNFQELLKFTKIFKNVQTYQKISKFSKNLKIFKLSQKNQSFSKFRTMVRGVPAIASMHYALLYVLSKFGYIPVLVY